MFPSRLWISSGFVGDTTDWVFATLRGPLLYTTARLEKRYRDAISSYSAFSITFGMISSYSVDEIRRAAR